MTLINWQKEKNYTPTLNTFFNDMFGGDLASNVATGRFIPAVNIKETDNGITLKLAAPGLKKEDFKIALDHNHLTISSEQKSEHSESEEGKYTRKEYSYHSFSRTFTLPNTIDAEKIDATYVNGELVVTLPKKEELKSLVKEINVN